MNGIREERNMETASVIIDTAGSSRDQGHEHRGNQIWGKLKNWEEKFGIRRLSSDYYNVGDPVCWSSEEGRVVV